jgi:Ras family protein A
LDGIEYFLSLTDIPSAPEFLPDRIKEYQKKADGIILCYAVNDPFSFQNLENQWIQEIKSYCPTNIPFIIIGTHIQ